VTREAHLKLAASAIDRATNLARDAESAARGDGWQRAEPLAAAGALWASIAVADAAVAQATPDDTNPEA
jgi:hypothetical protein